MLRTFLLINAGTTENIYIYIYRFIYIYIYRFIYIMVGQNFPFMSNNTGSMVNKTDGRGYCPLSMKEYSEYNGRSGSPPPFSCIALCVYQGSDHAEQDGRAV